MAQQLKRITTGYSVAEDRILLVGEDIASGRVEIWLTQRIIIRLLPVLFQFLLAPATPAKDGPAASLATGQSETLAPRLLVLKIDLKLRVQAADLIFWGADGERCAVTLSKVQLQQWLVALFAAFKKAGWPLTVWPDWMKQERPVPQRHLILH